MIDNKYNIENLYQNGPTLEVVIFPPEDTCLLYNERGIFPPSVRATAMIDTGASDTVIGPSIVERLNLTPEKSSQKSNTAAGIKETKVYRICVGFKDFTAKFGVYSLGQPINEEDIQVLIGRDILQNGGLIYEGEKNFYRLRL